MASYETIPAAAAEDGLLLDTPKPKTNSLKGLVAGAAMASFVLGMVAAMAVTQHASHPSPGFNTCSLNFVCKEIVETEFISADGLPAEPGTEIYSGDC